MIRAGETWGERVEPPAGLVRVADDAALAAHLAGGGAEPVAATGGDVLRALGGASRDEHLRRYPIDLFWVRLDDADPLPAIAHVVAHAPGRWRWWAGPLWAACNVSNVGAWDVAPRAHPNDGRLDVVQVDAAMPLRARIQAWRRLPTGTHVPHPAIHVNRAVSATFTPGRRVAVRVDGHPRGLAARVEVTVAPDAGWVHA